MYASSLYCITKKKGGWDCLRHYEILLAGCVPYFFDIGNMPRHSMVHFPHHLIRLLMQLPGVPSEDVLAARLSRNANVAIDRAVFPHGEYASLRADMLSFVESHLLCSHRASDLYGLKPRVFVHSQATIEKPVDYLRDLLLVGFLELGHSVYTTFNASYIFEDFDVSSLDAPWGVSYGRGFLYEQAVPSTYRHLYTFWARGDPPPKEPFSYIKTTYNNKPYPIETFFDKPVDTIVDGNDIWGAHPEPVDAAAWYRRELSDCHRLSKPAQVVLGILNSGRSSSASLPPPPPPKKKARHPSAGVLWNCEAAPGSHLCPSLHDAARIWKYGLQMTEELGMQTQGWRRLAQCGKLQLSHLHHHVIMTYHDMS